MDSCTRPRACVGRLRCRGFASFPFQVTVVLIALGLLAGPGCTAGWRTAQASYRQGQVDAAADQIQASVQAAQGSDHEVLIYLESATIARHLGDLSASDNGYESAIERMQYWADQPEASLSGEAAAALTNPETLAYRGMYHDHMMANVYLGLNYIEQGRWQDARTRLIAAFFLQREAVERNAERLAKAQEELEANEQVNHDAVEMDRYMADHYPEIGSFEPYGDFVNPYAEFVQGFYFGAVPADAADLDRAVLAFDRLADMVPDNPYIDADRAWLARRTASAGGGAEARTWVIFETGCCACRDDIQIHLPTVLVVGGINLSYVGAAFPTLTEDELYTPGLQVACSQREHTTRVVGQMDRVIREEFRQRLPGEIARAIAGSVTKAAAAYAINKAAERSGNEYAHLAAVIGTTIYQVSQNHADRRSWQSLPREFQYASFTTPEDGRLTLQMSGGNVQGVPGGGGRFDVVVEPGKMNLVWVRSIRPHLPPVIRTVPLERNP